MSGFMDENYHKTPPIQQIALEASDGGGENAVKRNWNCAVFTHFLPQKFTPLSTFPAIHACAQ